jgi:hypothetical protein
VERVGSADGRDFVLYASGQQVAYPAVGFYRRDRQAVRCCIDAEPEAEQLTHVGFPSLSRKFQTGRQPARIQL